MPATLVIPVGITGLTLTCDIYPDGSDTADATGQSLTEATNRKGYYTASITGLSGLKFVNVKNGSTVIGYGYAILATDGTVYLMDDRGTVSHIKKNQPLSKFMFLMTDSSQHLPATGKTVTVTRSIDGGAFAAGTLSAVTEVSNGMYYCDFAAADLNGSVIVLRATATGCDDTFERIVTQP